MTSLLRPDERAAYSEIERSKEREENIKKGIKTAVGIGTAATGIGISSRVLPFLSEYIPANLALKGISKVSPEIGNFLKKGMNAGLDLKSGLDFVKSNISQKEKSEPAKENRNVIQQYSPELFQFINDEIQKGKSPLEAGSLAESNKKFKSIIKKISEDHKAPFSAILKTVFGEGEKKANLPAEGVSIKSLFSDQSQAALQSQQPGMNMQQQTQRQGGNADAQLMAMLEKVSQVLKGP